MGLCPAAATSSPVSTAITPGMVFAVEASIAPISACGRSERRNTPQAWLGNIQSDT